MGWSELKENDLVFVKEFGAAELVEDSISKFKRKGTHGVEGYNNAGFIGFVILGYEQY